MAKRALIGLVATAALIAGIYFLQCEINKVWNPWGMSPGAHLGLQIGALSIFGAVCLALTAGSVFAAKDDLHHRISLELVTLEQLQHEL